MVSIVEIRIKLSHRWEGINKILLKELKCEDVDWIQCYHYEIVLRTSKM
jgi:hypothetical protein